MREIQLTLDSDRMPEQAALASCGSSFRSDPFTSETASTPRTLLALLGASTVFVPAVLLADGEGFTRQLTLRLLTAAMLWIVARRTKLDSTQIFVAIAVATTGEVILSVVLGLYDYRFATIPFYVPPGHGLFYALAAATARQPALQSHARSIVRGVLVAGSAVAIAGLAFAGDAWGAIWWVAAALLIARSSTGLLLAVCGSYTMLLEWLGTWVGNWAWAPSVLGLRSGNPPSGVGILYVVLDLVTVSICALPLLARERASIPDEIELGDAA